MNASENGIMKLVGERENDEKFERKRDSMRKSCG